jgi:glycyl-tRNA synthetase beta chain
VADRADVLVGCFGLGLTPTGSADPFALRRATLGLIRVAFEGPIDVDLRTTFAAAYAAYEAQDKPLAAPEEVLPQLDEFARGRLRAFFDGRHPTDVVEACLGAWDGGSLHDLRARLDALDAFRQQAAYESLAVAFKRAHNITRDVAFEPTWRFDLALADHDAEKALAEKWSTVSASIAAHAESAQYGAALALVAAELREPIDRFFDEVFVMVDDAAIRDNRLRLLLSIATTLSAIAHFHLLAGTHAAEET